MKNRIYYILLCLLVSFSFINHVFAEGDLEFTVSAIADMNEVVVGEEATVTLSLKADEAIANCIIKIEEDDTIERGLISNLNTWQAGYEGTEGLELTNNLSTDTATNGGVLQFKYKINGNGKVTFKTKECVSVVGDKIGTYQDVVVSFTTKEAVDDTTLSDFKVVSGGSLAGEFSSTSESIMVRLDSSKFSLEMTASNPDFQNKIVVKHGETVLDPSNITFSGDGGANQMLCAIYVNNVKQYDLFVVYEQTELDNTLSSLKVGGQTVELVDGKYDYKITVGKDVSSVKIEAVLKDSVNFRFVEGNGETSGYALSVGTNNYVLMIEPVSSELGASSQNYNLEIIREGGTSSSNNNSTPSSSSSKPVGGNTTTNPSTGGISMFVMAFILVASLVGSVILYQKNIEGYNK